MIVRSLPILLVALGCAPANAELSEKAARELQELLDRTPEVLAERLAAVVASVPPDWRKDGDAPELVRWEPVPLVRIDDERRLLGYLASRRFVPAMYVVATREWGELWALLVDEEQPALEWPVVHLDHRGGLEVVAANLRDFLAETLASYDPPRDWVRAGRYRDWTETVWRVLRLGQDDPDVRSERLARARERYLRAVSVQKEP